jgi:rubrerythrin
MVTYPQEMLPVSDEPADVIICCQDCGWLWVLEDRKCPNCGLKPSTSEDSP